MSPLDFRFVTPLLFFVLSFVGFVTLDIPGRGGENGSLDRLDDAVGAMVAGDGEREIAEASR
jgi:hypothetical protein